MKRSPPHEKMAEDRTMSQPDPDVGGEPCGDEGGEQRPGAPEREHHPYQRRAHPQDVDRVQDHHREDDPREEVGSGGARRYGAQPVVAQDDGRPSLISCRMGRLEARAMGSSFRLIQLREAADQTNEKESKRMASGATTNWMRPPARLGPTTEADAALAWSLPLASVSCSLSTRDGKVSLVGDVEDDREHPSPEAHQVEEVDAEASPAETRPGC